MSRCFSYPPPGYCKNGASYQALIDSIKLQKETDTTKAERKKEKRAKKENEKRQKERNNEDEYKLQKKNTNDDCYKVTQKTAEFTKAHIKGKDATTEQFEKSDLTEEYGPSISSSHQPSYSSDSTQDSNKRKRDASLQAESSSSHGMPIKIRFLKKHKGSDTSNIGTDAKSNTYLSVIPSSSNLDGSLGSSVRKNVVPVRDSRTLVQSNLILEVTKITDPKRLVFDRVQSAPNSVKPVLQSTRPQQPALPSFGRQFLPRIDDQSLSSGSQKQLVSNKLALNGITVFANDGSSRKQQKEDTQKVGLTRFEKKMTKKHAKYEKLMGSLFPPVFRTHQSVDDDENWLSRSKAANCSLSKGEVVETCRESVASWHPCVRFLADVDMHALPYTVPF